MYLIKIVIVLYLYIDILLITLILAFIGFLTSLCT